MGTIHIIPMFTTVVDLAMTDMALERSHWWITFIVMMPVYMLCNLWGAMTVGNIATGEIGSVYGFEFWTTNVPLTLFGFFIAASLQAGIFYGSAVCIDRIWPKRRSELYELNKNLLEDE